MTSGPCFRPRTRSSRTTSSRTRRVREGARLRRRVRFCSRLLGGRLLRRGLRRRLLRRGLLRGRLRGRLLRGRLLRSRLGSLGRRRIRAVVAGVVTVEACVTGESIARHGGDAAGSIIRRHNHQPPTTTPPRTARLKSLRMERTLTATRYPRHRLPTPQPALSAERNFSSAAPLLQKACC